jgi:hypothetical protein
MYQSYPSRGQPAGRSCPAGCWAALGSLAVAGCLAACSSSGTGTAAASPGPFASQAGQVVTDLAAGNYAAVESRFDPAMMQAAQTLPVQKAWAACQNVLGKYRSHGAPTFAQKGGYDLEQVPVTWGNGPGAVIITYDSSGTIAGLHCAPSPP